MKEQIIEFKTAKLADEKGFDLKPTVSYFYDRRDYNKDWDTRELFHKRNIGPKAIQAPTQSLLQKWLREKYKLRIFVHQGAAGNFKFDLFSYPIPNNIGKWERFNNIQSYTTYEEALEVGLYEALKLIKK